MGKRSLEIPAAEARLSPFGNVLGANLDRLSRQEREKVVGEEHRHATPAVLVKLNLDHEGERAPKTPTPEERMQMFQIDVNLR